MFYLNVFPFILFLMLSTRKEWKHAFWGQMGVCSNPEPDIFVILDSPLIHDSIFLGLHFSRIAFLHVNF